MEQDAAPARMVRSHAPGRLRVTVRANYVALPSVAGRELENGGEIRRDGRCFALASSTRKNGPQTEKPQHSGLRRLRKLVCAWSAARRCAFGHIIASHAMPEAKRYKVRLAALHAPHIEGTSKSSPRAIKTRER